MCLTRDIGGVLLAIATLALIAYGQYCSNRFFIFYWHFESNIQEQYVQGIPLDCKGFFYCLTFNGSCLMSYICHLRAAFSDPGRIKPGLKAPYGSESNYMEIVDCQKCEVPDTWKPARAHHCSECGFCVFKMDHHCPWINNCVGHRNMKYFLLFVTYVFISAVYSSLCMFLSFYNLLSTKSKTHMQQEGYSIAFIMSILAFIEGGLFAFFCYELLQEQFQSIEDNQSYIDDMKKVYGKQQDFFENFQIIMGYDFSYWLMPTHPELRINYFERLWSKKEVQRMYKTDVFETEEDDSDPDKKYFTKEVARSQKEKTYLWMATICGLLSWFFVVQDHLVLNVAKIS